MHGSSHLAARGLLASLPAVLILVSFALAAEQSSENLARTAAISASSEFSGDYVARHVADGHIPGAQSGADVGKAWCAKGNHHPGGVTLTFAFPDAVEIAEAVYFGRTAFEWQENWKDYEVFVDGGETAVAGGTLQAGHGPQRIALPEGLRAKSLTLKFLTSYGGSNPGASEIQLISRRLPDAAFASFSQPFAVAREEQWPASPVPEDAGMDRQLRSAGLGFSAEGRRRVDLTAVEQRRVFAWIDLNVPYYGTSESNHHDLIGCRQLLPANLEPVLNDVAARRCAACHSGDRGIPREPFVRITNVEHNSFLLAPLASSAGGSQRCATAVFQSKDDPDYQAILRTFESIEPVLRENPRADMEHEPTMHADAR
jgi:hypothetical protein